MSTIPMMIKNSKGVLGGDPQYITHRKVETGTHMYPGVRVKVGTHPDDIVVAGIEPAIGILGYEHARSGFAPADRDTLYAADDWAPVYHDGHYPVRGWLADGETVIEGGLLMAAAAGQYAAYDPAETTLTVKDDDNAASTGVAVYVRSAPGLLGGFEFVSPTDAEGKWGDDDSNIVKMHDLDGAATLSFQVYFDEDGIAGSRFLINNTVTLTDLYVPLSNGQLIKLTHDASAASNGVAIYFDEDGGTVAERVLFVSPTDTDGSDVTSDSNVLTNNFEVIGKALEPKTASGSKEALWLFPYE